MIELTAAAVLGPASGVESQLLLYSIERKIKHPAVAAIVEV